MARCSICQTLIGPEDETRACPECGQKYHDTCWVDIGGCATYGCERAAEARKPAPVEHVGGGWGDVKRCPSCANEIASSVLLCNVCGARFPWADPMTPGEYQQILEDQRRLRGTRRTLLLLFFLTLLGIPAPVTGPVAGIFAVNRRELLAGANGTYLAIGYGATAIGVLYFLIIVALMLGL